MHPLDAEAIRQLVAAHPVVVTVEDNALAGGFGSAILEFMSDEGSVPTDGAYWICPMPSCARAPWICCGGMWV